MPIRQSNSSMAALAMAISSGQSCPNHFQVTHALDFKMNISNPKWFTLQDLAECAVHIS